MKKIILLIILFSLMIIGCESQETVYVNNALEVNEPSDEEEYLETGQSNEEKLECTDGDIEADVNAVDLEKDEALTEKAEEEHKTEEDTLVPQEEIEQIQEEQEQIHEEEQPTDSEGEVVPLEEESQKNDDGFEIVKNYNTELPSIINLDIKYDKYSTSYDYLLITVGAANIREKPLTDAPIVGNATLYEKINLEQVVKGQYINKYSTDQWYKVLLKDGENIKSGYILSSLGEPRSYQFDKMIESINKLKAEADNNETAYISNYKNRSGRAPLYNGKDEDKYGIKRYQAAPAYIEPNPNSEFRYIADGTLITVLEKAENYTKIQTLNFEGEYWIPNKYISYYSSINELNKVVVIDRKNQNQGVFEFREGKWNLISYVLATTGANSKYKQPTELGYYMAIQTRDRFLYLDDVTREISGYAPYAIRFNGGAYIHGVPVEFKIVEGRKVDPGMREYLFTIGTDPRSHKCVRNYTSHAEFLYNWIDIGKSAIIVIE